MKVKPATLILVIALIAAATFGQILQQRLNSPSALAFEPIDGLPGWRQIAFEGITLPGGNASSAVLLGVGEEDPPERLSPEALCRLLYPSSDTRVPAAYFTDINCPNCQSLELKLNTRRDRLALTRLELPLLGPSSVVAAKAIIATRLQTDDDSILQEVAAMQKGPRLDGRVRSRLERAGLDPARVARDMEGAEVAAVLKTHQAAAETLRVWGTPALTLGTTLFMGDLDGDILDRLIDDAIARSGEGC